jgi:hypothetical protein
VRHATTLGQTPGAPRALAVAMAAFVALLAAAMRAYPGGTQWDGAASGNDFWRNYLCDLAQTVALNGQPNAIGSALARTAMTLLALALLPFFRTVTRLFPSRARLGACVRVMGYVAAVGAFPVALVPANVWHALHAVAIVVGGVSGIGAALLAAYGLLREEPPPGVPAIAAVAALLSATAAFALYVRQFFEPGPGPVAGAVLERIALLCVLAWMGAVAWRVGRGAPYDRHGR